MPVTHFFLSLRNLKKIIKGYSFLRNRKTPPKLVFILNLYFNYFNAYSTADSA